MSKARPNGRIVPAATAALLLVLMTGCVGGSGGGGEGGGSGEGKGGSGSGTGSEGQEPKVLASTDQSIMPFDAKIDVTKFTRTDDFVFVDFKVTNTGDEAGELYNELGEAERGADYTPAGVTLIDTANRKLYFSQSYKDETCYCLAWENYNIGPDDVIESWVAFPAPPADVKSLDIVFPIAAPLLDVPLSDGEAPGEPEADLGGPRVTDLRTTEEDLDSGTSKEESEEDLTLLLSSDVLFELNKSALTGKADKALRQVAEEIDASSATEVKIDGYTDNSGDDSINDPLSEKRAEAVEKKLSGLVTRDGVDFATAGHGSADPVADNDTEDGREKNRRVTVTFKK